MVVPLISTSEPVSDWFILAEKAQWRQVIVEDLSGKAFRHLARFLSKEQDAAARIGHLELVGSPRHGTLLSIHDLSTMLGACLQISRAPVAPRLQSLKRVTLRGVFLIGSRERGERGVALDALRLDRVEEASPGAMTQLLGMFSRITMLYVDGAREFFLPDKEGAQHLAALEPLGVESLRITKTEQDGVMGNLLALLRMRGELSQLTRLQAQCRSVEELLSVFEVMHHSAETLAHVSLNLVDAWNLGVPDIPLDEDDFKSDSRYLDFYKALPILSNCTRLTDFYVSIHLDTMNPTQNVWRWRALEAFLYHIPTPSLQRVQIVLFSTTSHDIQIQAPVPSRLGSVALQNLEWMFVDRALALVIAANPQVKIALRTPGEFLPEQRLWLQRMMAQVRETGGSLLFPAYQTVGN